MAEAAKLPDDARERLRQHFLHDRTPNRWDELWKDGTFLPWDRGVPNPALEDTLVNTTLIGSPLRQDGTRKRALVPGCGKGYDVHLLAAHGYDAFGLEVGNAVEAARKFAGEVSQREEYAAKDKTVGKGNVEFVEGDFYKGDWEKSVAGDQSGFDIIYDYTFLCAMPPEKRPAWSHRMAALLAPSGTLICLEFPTYKEPSTGGPPWGVTPETYEMLLGFPGEEPQYDADGYVVHQEGRPGNPDGMIRIAHWKAERSHPVGQGTDNVSLWKPKDDGADI